MGPSLRVGTCLLLFPTGALQRQRQVSASPLFPAPRAGPVTQQVLNNQVLNESRMDGWVEAGWTDAGGWRERVPLPTPGLT